MDRTDLFSDGNEWKVLESKYLFKHKFLTIRSDRIQLPTGIILDNFFVIENQDWVNVIALTKKGQFVLERQYRHGIRKIGIEICAGMIDDGETPLQAAQRELLEETGYGGGEWIAYGESTPNPASMTVKNYTYLAKNVEILSEPSLEPTEHIEVFLAFPNEVFHYLNMGYISEGVMPAPLWRFFYENKLYF